MCVVLSVVDKELFLDGKDIFFYLLSNQLGHRVTTGNQVTYCVMWHLGQRRLSADINGSVVVLNPRM